MQIHVHASARNNAYLSLYFLLHARVANWKNDSFYDIVILISLISIESRYWGEGALLAVALSGH